jgi:hypothetical protein
MWLVRRLKWARAGVLVISLIWMLAGCAYPDTTAGSSTIGPFGLSSPPAPTLTTAFTGLLFRRTCLQSAMAAAG